MRERHGIIMEVYLDNSATTRCFNEVAEQMTKIMLEDYGNPSSMHLKGVESERYIRNAKETLAKILKVSEKEILFTSGGTESDNMALLGISAAYRRMGNHLITTQIEHPAILQTMNHLEELGYRITYLSVDENGVIDLDELEKSITKETILVSIMHTNNEIGSLQPIAEAGAIIKQKNPRTLFHVDAVQGFGKAAIYPKKMNIDLMSVSSHKIHGPKGVGFLYVNEKVRLQPIVFGGGQQKGLRSGTENVPGIAGMALAAKMMYQNLQDDIDKLYHLKELFTAGIKEIPDCRINGYENRKSAPHIVSVAFRGVRSEVLLHALEDKGIYVSAGSACASNKPQTSRTLMAIRTEKDLLDSTIRFSFSVFTTEEEITYTLDTLKALLPLLRKYTRR